MFGGLVLALELALLPAAPLPERPPQIPGPSPQIVIVQDVNKDQNALQFVQTELVPVAKEVPVQVNVGGKVEIRKQVVVEYVPVTKTISRPLKDLKVYDTEGKEVPAEDVLKRVKAGSAVVLATGTGKVDPAYLKILNKEALILVAPPQPRGVSVTPAPGPKLPPPEK